jgi:hypothetical protein
MKLTVHWAILAKRLFIDVPNCTEMSASAWVSGFLAPPPDINFSFSVDLLGTLGQGGIGVRLLVVLWALRFNARDP